MLVSQCCNWYSSHFDSVYARGHKSFLPEKIRVLESTWYIGHYFAYEPPMIDNDECGAVGSMKIDKGNKSSKRKAVPVSLRPLQIPYDLNQDGTRAAAVGNCRQTALSYATATCSKLYFELTERIFCTKAPHHAEPDFTVERVAFLLRILEAPDTDTG
jgi:hypothetical protein